MNESNLKKFTRQNAKANGAKGGKRSGETKRERKRIKDIITEIMEKEAPADDKLFLEYDMPYYSNAVILAIKLVERAKDGDVRAMKLLLEIIGEMESGKVVNINVEENELYQKGYRKGQADVFAYLSNSEMTSYLDRLTNNEKVYDDKPLILPDGRIIGGENELED